MQSEGASMPNKTIYVADADLPLFERAQELAGGNLSSAIAQALRQYCTGDTSQNTATPEGEEIVVKVGRNGAFIQKRFHGHQIAKQFVPTQNGSRQIYYHVYLTTKGNFALHIKDAPNWTHWATRKWNRQNDVNGDWSCGDWSQHESRLEVYDSLAALKDHVPPELYDVVARTVAGNPSEIEDLDI